MDFTSGYYFFETKEGNPACGYVLLRYAKGMLKIQCVAENISVATGRSVLLRAADSLNMEKPFTLGRMYLNGNSQMLRGEQNFTLNLRNIPSLGNKYDCMELVSEQTRMRILRTKPAPRQEKEPLRRELTGNGIYPAPGIAEEIKEGMRQYAHILLGSYTPHNTNKHYFLLGIPCNQPENTPDKIYRWINKCVELPEYPEFDGYKLYYYDQETGAAVKAVLRS